MVAEEGSGHTGGEFECAGRRSHCPDGGEGESRGRCIVHPGVEVLGDHGHVKPGLLGQNGVLHELLRLPLFVAAEIGEFGQCSAFRASESGYCQVYW